MLETYFELLIYACSQEELASRARSRAKKVMADVPNYGNGFWEEQLEDEIRRYSRPVWYNELVGCIQIHVVGSQLRADYSYTDKKHIVIGSSRKGTVLPKGKLLETHYANSKMASPDIFHDFREKLRSRIKQHSRLRHRFVECAAFDRCGPLLDWRSVLGL